jgi:hypothetical protein
MKRAFVSYSVEDSNLHLITLLLEHLRKNNFDVSVSTLCGDSYLRIANADIFIGIITNKGNSINYVVEEWQTARRNKIPYVLVVENGVKVKDPESLSFIRFNRSNPQEAIDRLFNIRRNSANVSSTKKNNGNSTSDVLIGVAIIAGIAALISMLSKNE